MGRAGGGRWTQKVVAIAPGNVLAEAGRRMWRSASQCLPAKGKINYHSVLFGLILYESGGGMGGGPSPGPGLPSYGATVIVVNKHFDTCSVTIKVSQCWGLANFKYLWTD